MQQNFFKNFSQSNFSQIALNIAGMTSPLNKKSTQGRSINNVWVWLQDGLCKITGHFV